MLSSKTRKRISGRKWSKHSNTSVFFSRVKNSADGAFYDLTLIANQFEDIHLQKIFSEEKFSKLLFALYGSRMNPDRKFTIEYRILSQTLEHTEKLIDNKLLKQMYKEHKTQLKKIIDSIYQEKQTAVGKQSLLELKKD